MNEKIIDFSNYTVCLRVGYDIQYIDLAFLAVICDKFLLEELCDIIAQSPLSTVVYSGIRNKTRFYLQISPKDDI